IGNENALPEGGLGAAEVVTAAQGLSKQFAGPHQGDGGIAGKSLGQAALAAAGTTEQGHVVNGSGRYHVLSPGKLVRSPAVVKMPPARVGCLGSNLALARLSTARPEVAAAPI